MGVGLGPHRRSLAGHIVRVGKAVGSQQSINIPEVLQMPDAELLSALILPLYPEMTKWSNPTVSSPEPR